MSPVVPPEIIATLSERVTGSPVGWRTHAGRERWISADYAFYSLQSTLAPGKRQEALWVSGGLLLKPIIG